MKLIPIKSATEYLALQNVETLIPQKLDSNAKTLAKFVMAHGHPCVLAFLPEINCEKVGFREISLVEHIFHRNAKMLVQAPCSPSLYDAKGAYMEAFSSKAAHSLFFGNTTSETVSMRTVMEIIALFDLTADELRLISTKPCMLSSESFREPLYDVLAQLPTNNEIAKKIEEVHRKVKNVSLPARIVKAKRMMYIDIVHAFRALGVDPYEAIVAIVKKNDEWFTNIEPEEPDPRAFDMKTLQSYLLDLVKPPKSEPSEPIVEEVLLPTTEGPAAIPEPPTSAPAVPVEEPAIPVVDAALPSSAAISLQARIRIPCDTNAWDNDNPNRNEPGYRWETCSEELCANLAAKLATMDLSDMSVKMIKTFIETELQYSCHAKLTADSDEFKMTLQI